MWGKNITWWVVWWCSKKLEEESCYRATMTKSHNKNVHRRPTVWRAQTTHFWRAQTTPQPNGGAAYDSPFAARSDGCQESSLPSPWRDYRPHSVRVTNRRLVQRHLRHWDTSWSRTRMSIDECIHRSGAIPCNLEASRWKMGLHQLF